MSGATGQALGMAVGAAVGSIGGPAGAMAGAQIGGGAVGFLQEKDASKTQSKLDKAALDLNREQARLQASERSSIHARNFRQSLASQLAMASMRGGSGSLVRQFGQEAYRSFLDDQQAIASGLSLQEAKLSLQGAESEANRASRDMAAFSRLTSTATRGVDLNLFK